MRSFILFYVLNKFGRVWMSPVKAFTVGRTLVIRMTARYLMMMMLYSGYFMVKKLRCSISFLSVASLVTIMTSDCVNLVICVVVTSR